MGDAVEVQELGHLGEGVLRQLVPDAADDRRFVGRDHELARVALGTPHPLMFAGDGLFAAIGLQLALVASVSRRLAMCSGCGVVFTPRRLQAGRAAYCRTCGAKAARRDASRRYREREGVMGST
jgi:hypothetical protein